MAQAEACFYFVIKTKEKISHTQSDHVFFTYSSHIVFSMAFFRTKRLKNADGNQIGMNVPVHVYENNAAREQAPELGLYNYKYIRMQIIFTSL